MPAPLALTLSALLRLAALLAVDVLFLKVVDIPSDDGLAAGLLAFLVVMALSGTWGLVDGLRWSVARLVIVWVVAGVLYGLVSPVLGDLLFPPVDWGVTLDDLRELGPFSLGLVCVPALLFGGFAAVVGSGPSATTPASDARRG